MSIRTLLCALWFRAMALEWTKRQLGAECQLDAIDMDQTSSRGRRQNQRIATIIKRETDEREDIDDTEYAPTTTRQGNNGMMTSRRRREDIH